MAASLLVHWKCCNVYRGVEVFQCSLKLILLGDSSSRTYGDLGSDVIEVEAEEEEE